eukprot:Em0003g1161a
MMRCSKKKVLCKKAKNQTKDDPLHCNGVKWSVVSNVSEDTRAQPCYRAMILWDNNTEEEKRTVLDYFKLSFPMQIIDNIVEWTSQAMPPGKRGINSATILKLFGYLRALTRTTSRRRNLFSECDGLFPAPCFGTRFGLSQHRTDMLLRALRFYPLTDVDINDKWSSVRRLIDAFNLRRAEVFYPSWQICVDESISAWRGKDGNFCSDGLPHVSKIDRKPKGVGTELKDAADAESKKAGTAQVLRLTKPWHGTGRAVYADSAFASVTTAIACRQKGLHFTGLVKTATTKFLKKLISTIPGIIETDAYLMWKHFHPDGRNWNHASFTEELAMQLLSIPEDETSPNVSLDSSADVITLKGHEICPMSELEQYKNKQTNVAHETPAQTEGDVGWRPSGSILMDGTTDLGNKEEEIVAMVYCYKNEVAQEMTSCTRYWSVHSPETAGTCNEVDIVMSIESTFNSLKALMSLLEKKPSQWPTIKLIKTQIKEINGVMEYQDVPSRRKHGGSVGMVRPETLEINSCLLRNSALDPKRINQVEDLMGMETVIMT